MGSREFYRDIPKMVEMTKQIVNSTKLPVTVKTRLGWDENTKYIVEVSRKVTRCWNKSYINTWKN